MGLFGLFGKKKKNQNAKLEQKKTEAQTTAAQKPEEQKTQAPKTEPMPEAKKPEPPKSLSSAKQKTAAKQKPAPKAEAAPAKKPAPKVEEKAEPKKSAVGKFEIKKSKDDRYVFNLYAANKVIVATSQVYSSSSVIENAAKAPVEDQTLKSYDTLPYPKWEIYQDKGGQYRFRLNASNGSCICHSQGYTSKASCKNGIESIIRTAKDAEIDKSYLKKD